MSTKPVVCICGGGNGAHVMAGLAASNARALDVRVLTLYENEADNWTKKMAEGDFVVAKHHPETDQSVEEIKAKPSIVTKDPSKAVPGADVIIFCVPAFAHQQYFTAIEPYVTANAAIIGLPGKPGFEFQCFDILKDKAKTCAILNYESLPWVCRIAEFGRKVDLLGTKDVLMGCKVASDSFLPREDPVQLLQTLLGPQPALSLCHNALEMLLMTKSFIHPPLMYGRWKDWDNRPLSDKPLFYQGLDEFAASVLSSISEEIVNTARAIEAVRPDVTLSHVEPFKAWFLRTYQRTVQDSSSLHKAMQTNSPYHGLCHPMKEISPGQFVPDFKYRYLTEDLPFCLLVTKGVADIMGVDTPYTDKVVTWAQGHLGKEYVLGSKLKGKDVKESRAPQAFGLTTLNDLMAFV